MQTIQIRITRRDLKVIDIMVKRDVYPSRSEAVRDAVRHMIMRDVMR